MRFLSVLFLLFILGCSTSDEQDKVTHDLYVFTDPLTCWTVYWDAGSESGVGRGRVAAIPGCIHIWIGPGKDYSELRFTWDTDTGHGSSVFWGQRDESIEILTEFCTTIFCP